MLGGERREREIMSGVLALSSGAAVGMAVLGVFLILWFFWWQHTRTDVFYDDGFVSCRRRQARNDEAGNRD